MSRICATTDESSAGSRAESGACCAAGRSPRRPIRWKDRMAVLRHKPRHHKPVRGSSARALTTQKQNPTTKPR